MNIACPNCRSPLTPDLSMAGQPVICPLCSHHFVVPPIAAASPAVSSVSGFSNTFSTVAASRFKKSTSVLDIFDFKFEKYLTPWIIRVTWKILLLVSVLGVMIITIAAVMLVMPATHTKGDVRDRVDDTHSRADDQARNTQRVNEQPRYEFHLEKLLPGSATSEIYFAFLFWSIYLLWVLISLLWARVALETMIVIFNIAESLGSIDKKIKG